MRLGVDFDMAFVQKLVAKLERMTKSSSSSRENAFACFKEAIRSLCLSSSHRLPELGAKTSGISKRTLQKELIDFVPPVMECLRTIGDDKKDD